jgi:hypothetical protein
MAEGGGEGGWTRRRRGRRGERMDTAAQRETGRAAQQEAALIHDRRAAVAVGLGGRGGARAAQTLSRCAGRREENGCGDRDHNFIHRCI